MFLIWSGIITFSCLSPSGKTIESTLQPVIESKTWGIYTDFYGVCWEGSASYDWTKESIDEWANAQLSPKGIETKIIDTGCPKESRILECITQSNEEFPLPMEIIYYSTHYDSDTALNFCEGAEGTPK